ncbi:MAG TPA: hypothetical protein PLX89_14045 [Verrucomicrobiota bacterium]|nr:hypothetical protein [Verrucomicrobiota bacterium]
MSFANEVLWHYRRDPVTGRQVHQRRVPAPTYTLRCFVLARAVRQFHAHARFDSAAPALDEGEYRRRVREVIRSNPRTRRPADARVLFPGFACLRDFSQRWERLLKAEAGGAWRSYLQRGHWRMIFPFSRTGQAKEAERLVRAVHTGEAVVAHVFTFPALTLNHALVLATATETPARVTFEAYDPNQPNTTVALTFDRDRRQFTLPPVDYFIGGPINVYEVYAGFLR